MRKFDAETPRSVTKALNLAENTRDYFLMFDSPSELADFAEREAADTRNMQDEGRREWYGGLDTRKSLDMARRGDLAGVKASDALMSRFERFAFETGRKAWLDDVTGAIPNVPAFIAGHPLAMLRRTLQDSAAAPIAIVADLTTSAALSADQIRRRGAAILALVRILSSRRPVELWAGCSLDGGKINPHEEATHIYARIETAPLDLVTAAHVMTHASFPRRLIYGISKTPEYKSPGYYPYGVAWSHRPYMSEIVAPAFTHTSETLIIPAISSLDESVNDPEKWIEQRLAELSPVDLAA
jgi:hypothetical protein